MENTLEGKDMKFYQLEKHSKHCYAVKTAKTGDWSHPWGVIRQTYVSGSSNTPKRRGYTQWFTVGCNCVGCPAELAIRFDDIMVKAPIGVRRKNQRKQVRI